MSAVNGYFQINVQTPHEARLIEPADPPWVEVRIEQLSATDRHRVAEGSATLRLRQKPGDFFLLAFGEPHSAYMLGQPAVFRASDFSLITPSNPARRGDILTVFATGLAPTAPVIPTGAAAPFVPLAQVPFVDGWPLEEVAKGTVVVANSRKILPLFVGLAPGLVGVYQINFRLSGAELPYEGVFYLQIEGIECSEGSYSCRQSPTTYWQSKPVLVPYKPD